MAAQRSSKKPENHSTGSHLVTTYRSSGSEKSTRREMDQSEHHRQQQYVANSGSSRNNGTRTQTLTLTQQFQRYMPTLILKLKQKHNEQQANRFEMEEDHNLKRHIESFRDMLFRNIDQFQEIILSARPLPNEINTAYYQQQKAAYCELLKGATALARNMQETLNTVLTEYRLFIEELWETICAGRDPTAISTRFQQQTEAYMKQSWDPLFDRANEMIDEIERSRR